MWEYEKLVNKPVENFILTLACLQILLIAKAVAVALSNSTAIISSLVDSAVDLLSGIIIWWTSKAMKNRNIYQYPGGNFACRLFWILDSSFLSFVS